jgi:hypothetical protein
LALGAEQIGETLEHVETDRAAAEQAIAGGFVKSSGYG